MESKKDQVMQRIRELSAQAKAEMGVMMPKVDITFDLEGSKAGVACQNGSRFWIRFNATMMESSWDSMISETVPHELAHIVCLVCPFLGKGHDKGWKRVCKDLGGSGNRCHATNPVYAKGKTYEYTTTTGALVNVSQIMHKRIQLGKNYKVHPSRGGGLLTKACSVTIVV